MGLRDALPRRGWIIISSALLIDLGLYFVPKSIIGIQPRLFIILIVMLQGVLVSIIIATFLHYHDETAEDSSSWRYDP